MNRFLDRPTLPALLAKLNGYSWTGNTIALRKSDHPSDFAAALRMVDGVLGTTLDLTGNGAVIHLTLRDGLCLEQMIPLQSEETETTLVKPAYGRNPDSELQHLISVAMNKVREQLAPASKVHLERRLMLRMDGSEAVAVPLSKSDTNS